MHLTAASATDHELAEAILYTVRTAKQPASNMETHASSRQVSRKKLTECLVTGFV
jgi:hypothetical protein